MAYDISNQPEVAGLSWDGLKKAGIEKVEIDFTIAANQLAQNKTMAVMRIPAGVLIEEVMILVKTVDANITNVDAGPFTASTEAVIGSADAFIDNATLASTGLKRDFDETYSPVGGTNGLYCVADTDIVLTNIEAATINEAVIDVIAKCVDLR
jgi:hypothetical protein